MDRWQPEYDSDRPAPVFEGDHVTPDLRSPVGGAEMAAAIPGAASNPTATALSLLLGYAQREAQERAANQKAINAILQGLQEKYRPLGFASIVINYRPVDAAGLNLNGVQTVDMSDHNGKAISYFSLVTVAGPTAPSADPNGSVIYGAFGRRMFTNAIGTAPANYDFLLPIGGKIQKYHVRQGLEAISLYSKTAFDAILYITPGTRDELPEL